MRTNGTKCKKNIIKKSENKIQTWKKLYVTGRLGEDIRNSKWSVLLWGNPKCKKLSWAQED